MSWSLGEKAFIAQLPLGICNVFFALRDFFFLSLALGGHVDGALVDDGCVEIERRVLRQPGCDLFNEAHFAHARQPFDNRNVFVENRLHSGVDAHLNRCRGLLFDADLLAQCANLDDNALQYPHIDYGRIAKMFIALRITCQRNRLCRRVPVVKRMPKLFRQERHNRRQQPQRGFEDADQSRERSSCLFLICAL